MNVRIKRKKQKQNDNPRPAAEPVAPQGEK